MAKLSPMQIVRELTKLDNAVEAKKAFAKSLLAKKINEKSTRKTAELEELQKLSNLQLLRLARRHAPELLGAHAPKPKPAKKTA